MAQNTVWALSNRTALNCTVSVIKAQKDLLLENLWKSHIILNKFTPTLSISNWAKDSKSCVEISFISHDLEYIGSFKLSVIISKYIYTFKHEQSSLNKLLNCIYSWYIENEWENDKKGKAVYSFNSVTLVTKRKKTFVPRRLYFPALQ